ncbi:MAG: type II toxin-antitoxin system HicA family toxin [Nitrospinae bacterium]|nr:type II toxin-antitoxin system HicA family toxin [Nitrospinota bacterium]
MPALTARDVIRILERNGFKLDHSSGSHRVYYNSQTRRRAVLPFHRKDVPVGTLTAILKGAGLPREEWRKT